MGEKLSWMKNNWNIMRSLVINDFKSRYVGSYLGFIWGFVQPLITIFIYWFVFAVGFRSGDRADGTPYIIWLIVGIVPWFFFSEALSSATGTFWEYSYLVKKLSFRVGVLPVVKICSSIITHLFFVLFAFLIMFIYKIEISIFTIQIIYYFVCMVFFLFGFALFTSSINVFFRDMGQIVGVFMQIGFWLIPIVWTPETLSPFMQKLFKLNPMYYIVEGYRDSLISAVPFWAHPYQSVYFWVFSIALFILGLYTFKRLKVSFSDVL